MSAVSVPTSGVGRLWSRTVDVFTSPKSGPVLVTAVLFVVMFLAGGARYRGFLSATTILNLMVSYSYLIVLAVGMSFVIISGGIDLSVGSVLALSTIIAARLLQFGWNPIVVILLILVITSVLGLLVGLMVHVFEIQPFIATLAAMFLARGMCYIIAKESISITDPFFSWMAKTRIILGYRMSITPSVVIALVVLAIAVWVLQYTRFGRTTYAIGGGEQSGMLMGLPTSRTKVLVYVISGFCSGLAGVLYAFYTLSGYALTGVGTELDAIAAVVIGGTLLTGGYGFVLGSALGVLVLGLIQTMITFEGTLSSWWTKIFIGALLLVFIILQKVLTSRRA
ncbi:MAG: sugar ABC transporter permease YjfF [Actinobacteria bacterium]|nr:sugar ABC transporter permease YjfF [Actinomycetota bacterium]